VVSGKDAGMILQRRHFVEQDNGELDEGPLVENVVAHHSDRTTTRYFQIAYALIWADLPMETALR